ncbi:MAG: arsenate reductase family protein [Myxococcota bacterium]
MKARPSAGVTIYHNPNCSTSKYAITAAQEHGVSYTEVRYLKDKPDRATLEQLVAQLEDPPEDLIRKDSLFKRLELDPDDYVGDPDAVIELLSERIALLQRPVLVKRGRAIIGRPKDRVIPFLTE